MVGQRGCRTVRQMALAVEPRQRLAGGRRADAESRHQRQREQRGKDHKPEDAAIGRQRQPQAEPGGDQKNAERGAKRHHGGPDALPQQHAPGPLQRGAHLVLGSPALAGPRRLGARASGRSRAALAFRSIRCCRHAADLRRSQVHTSPSVTLTWANPRASPAAGTGRLNASSPREIARRAKAAAATAAAQASQPGIRSSAISSSTSTRGRTIANSPPLASTSGISGRVL